MATDTLRAESAHVTLAPELRALEKRAGEYEEGIRQARAALTALFHSGLLDDLGSGSEGRLDEPCAGALLIDMIAERLKSLNGAGGLDLGDKLGFLAHRLEHGQAHQPAVPGLSEWGEALLALKCADDWLEVAGGDEADVDRAASLHHEAVIKLLTTPAPDGSALTRKLKLYQDYQAYSYREAPEIVDVLNADTVRLLEGGLRVGKA